jgi:hypothetical protein
VLFRCNLKIRDLSLLVREGPYFRNHTMPEGVICIRPAMGQERAKQMKEMTTLEWLLLGGFIWLTFRLEQLGRQLGAVCYVIRRDILKTEEEKEALLRQRLDDLKDQRQQDWGLAIMGTIALLYFLGWLGPIFGFLAGLVYLAWQALHRVG